MNATEIILSAVMFVLFLGLRDAHNRLDDFGKWQRATIQRLPRPKPKNELRQKFDELRQKFDELRGVIKNRDTTISMLNAQIRGLNFENEKYISQIAAKDEYINELKGDLTKCKHDYACEVVGAKTEEDELKKSLGKWGKDPVNGNGEHFLDENLKDIPTQNVNNSKQ